MNSARSGRPDWTHTVLGARNVADPLSPTADTDVAADRDVLLAVRSVQVQRTGQFRRRRAARSAQGHPQRAATLAGEKTVSAASSASTWYMSAPNAASAATAARASVSAAESFRTVPSYPP